MANIGVRSPYFIYEAEVSGTPVSAKMTLTIGGSNVYYIVKDTGDSFLVDISEIVRDYVTPSYDGTMSSSDPGSVSVSTSVQFYDAANAGGSTVGTPHTQSHTAYDAYGYYEDGNNFSITGVPLTGTTIWAPENTAGSYFSAVGTVTSYSTSDTTSGSITIERFPCSKYTPVKIVFINKYGVPQELWFFVKHVESTSSQRSTYKSSAITVSGSYTATDHQTKTLSTQGKVKYTLNTGFVAEDYNEFMRELLLSEQVWMVYDGSTRPVLLTSSDVQFKTSLNDKMVQYTIEVEQANDLISSMR